MNKEFKSYPKIPRLNKLAYTVTEKLDGTNGLISIENLSAADNPSGDDQLLALLDPDVLCVVLRDNVAYAVRAGSRTRWLNTTSDGDNYGFAKFVHSNADAIVGLLGEGEHYGEWWGQGIQRNYGLDRRFFTLFNPTRYPQLPPASQQVEERALLGRVELLGEMFAPFTTDAPYYVNMMCEQLIMAGSITVPGWATPEGVVVQIGGERHKIIFDDAAKKANG